MPALLEGVSIIDLTSVLSGPYATRMLADFGADVIKIESPGTGDLSRGTPPSRTPLMTAMFMSLNRNKRSLVLDLKDASERQRLLELVPRADVFVHNMRSSAISRLGLGFEELKAVNPRLVYCSCWGYGSDGPYADRPALDDTIQAMGGAVALHAASTGRPGYMATAMADKIAGLNAAIAIASALVRRERTGQGAHLEIPMFESMVHFLLAEHLGQATWLDGGSAGYERLLMERGPFRTTDGLISIFPITTAHWQSLFSLTSTPEFAESDLITDVARRNRNLPELYGRIARETPSRSTAEWIAELQRLHIPFGIVNELDDLFDDPHLRAVRLFQETYEYGQEPIRQVRLPVLVDGERPEIRMPAPRLGEHTDEILGTVPMSDG